MEIRWLIRENWEGLPEYEENPKIETVLQWRNREGRGEDWWGEWQDIPVEDQRYSRQLFAANRRD